MSEYDRQYYAKHKDKIKRRKKIYYINNTAKMKERFKQYCIDYPEKVKESGRSWESLAGYTCDKLIKHLQKIMPEGYVWQDYLNGKLHIDHIVPISVFNYEKPEHKDFKRCWALKNLRLLPARENLVKHNKLTRPFQPALKI